MMTIEKIAQALARTRFGRRALTEEADLSVFRSRPSPQFYLGLGLIGLSYLLGLPAMALIGYQAYQGAEKPWILIIGAGVVMVLIHLMFAAGVYLAGGNYVLVLLRWMAARFLRKYLT